MAVVFDYRETRGMSNRRERTPSGAQHHFVWASSLRGMEQPVRSSRSVNIICNSPAHSGSNRDKPLPPLPTVQRNSSENVSSGRLLAGLNISSTLANSRGCTSDVLVLNTQLSDPSCPDPSYPHDLGLEITDGPTAIIHSLSSVHQPKLYMKRKTFASLGIEISEDQQSERRPWLSPFGFMKARHDSCSNLSMRGKEFQSPSQKSTEFRELSIDNDINERLQHLSVLQDYHNILVDSYQKIQPIALGRVHQNMRKYRKAKRTAACVSVPQSPFKAHELVLKPLGWKKRPRQLYN
ncbi:hypothetical protein GQ44DRAFT_721213 [Phaeosphaeriaceae sp. PMI808]|nr:hypothetical protein GQ44DRAFT_721213 [Phaeosphaeriaceae sp. PMI808]